ncbi:uncharacterized protein ACIQIH_004086 isoform 3-T3 [Cyanocitta cristata]
MPRRRPESQRCPAAGGSALGLAGAAPHSLLPPCVRVCKRLPLLLAAAAAASRPTFSPPRSVSGELLLQPRKSSPPPRSPPPCADLLFCMPCFARTPHCCTRTPSRTRLHLASRLPPLLGWDGSALE